MPPADDPNLTVVGGTALTTTGLHTYGTIIAHRHG
jgi:hypothetical protein